MLQRDLRLGGRLGQALDHLGVVAGAVGDAGPLAQFDLPVLFLRNAGGIGGMGHVEDDGDVGEQAVRDHARPVAADLLLHGVDGDDGGGGPLLGGGQAFEHAGDDEPADAVVEGAPDQPVLAEAFRGVAIHGRMADADPERGHFRGAAGAHVDVEVLDLRGLLVGEIVLAQVDGGVADDAAHGPLVAQDLEAAAPRRGDVGPADAVEMEEARLGDVLDDVADLVGMGLEHDRRAIGRRALAGGPGGAVGVAFQRVGERAHKGGPFALSGCFEAGGGRGGQVVEQKLLGVLLHGGRASASELAAIRHGRQAPNGNPPHGRAPALRSGRLAGPHGGGNRPDPGAARPGHSAFLAFPVDFRLIPGSSGLMDSVRLVKVAPIHPQRGRS